MSHFLPQLNAPYLRELTLSSMGLTRISLPHILAYLSSPRCYPLGTLKINGNDLEHRSIRKITKSIDKHNFTLIRLEMYANNLADRGDSPQDSDDEPMPNGPVFLSIFSRNGYLKKQTEKEALTLLRCARATLLRSKSPPSPDDLQSPDAVFPFSRLPTELQLHVLKFVAPNLSTSQRLRIFEYASNPSTLPPLLPRLGRSNPPEWGVFGSSPGEEERTQWLDVVRCDHYDVDG